MSTDAAAPLGEKHEPTAMGAALIKRVPLPATVAHYVLSDDEIRRTWRLASSLAASKLFKDTYQAEQAFGKILIGRDLGLSPTQALQTLDIVEGAIFMRGVLLASFVRKSQNYHYKVLERTNEKCRLLFLGYPQDEPADDFVRSAGAWWEVLAEEEFTIEDARRGQLVKVDKPKSGWMAYPKNMCFWRCISNAVKIYAPDLLGGVPVYTEADSRPDTPALGEGHGDGQPVGLDLGPDVEAVIERATDLGHAALADRATIEVQLGDQPPGKVVEWVKAANRELDEMPADAEVVHEAAEAPVSPETALAADLPSVASEGPQESDTDAPEAVTDPERIEALRRRAQTLLNDADALDEDGNHGDAGLAREEAEIIMTQVEAAESDDQGQLL